MLLPSVQLNPQIPIHVLSSRISRTNTQIYLPLITVEARARLIHRGAGRSIAHHARAHPEKENHRAQI